MSDGGYDGDTLQDDRGNEVMKAHADLVKDQKKELERHVARDDDNPFDDKTADEYKLLESLISAGCDLEAQARRIMMNQLPEGSAAQTLLRADRNQQLRDMRSLGLPEEEMKKIMAEEAGDDAGDLVQQTSDYRKAFALFLASASRLKKLRGKSEDAFERRRADGDDGRDQGGSDLSGFVDGQERAKGVGGQGDQQAGGKEKAAGQELDKDQGPASGMEKAMNISKA